MTNMPKDLRRRKAVLRLSDPWDLGKALGWKELKAVIVDVKFEGDLPISLIVKLAEPFNYQSIHCEFFIVSPRLEGSGFGQLKSGRAIFSGMTRIPADQVDTDDPFDLSYWRGGVALIGEIELA